MFVEKAATNYSDIQQLFKIRGEHLFVKKDDKLLQTKDSANCFYLVLDGSIDLVFNIDSQHSFSRIVVKNEFFGFDELMGRSAGIKTAIAIENSELLRLSIIDLNPPKPELQNHQRNTTQPANRLSQSVFDANLIKVTDFNDIKIIYCMFQRANLNNAVDFKNYILDLINAGNTKLVIDLTASKIIDSTFLGSLVVLLKKVSALNGKLSLVCNNDVCSWLFVMTKMDNVFNIYQTMDDALNAMND